MNTKHISLAFALLTAAALLAGCEKNPLSGRQANLELSSVSTNETKAVIDGTIFPKDGHIGLFLFKDESAVTPYGDADCSNVEYSYNGNTGKWTANPPISVGGEPGYLYGYYPYSSAVTDIKAIPVSSSLNGDDVMYATKQTVTDETASQTAIKMNHALARVTITVVNNGYTLGKAELSSIKFSGAGASVNGILDATSGIISGTTKSDVILAVPSGKQSITAEGTVYECLLVPSEEESLVQTLDLTLNIDGNDKTTTLSGDTGITIARNTKSNVTIALSNTGISVQTVSIDDWKVVEVGGHKVTVKFDNVVVPNDILTDIHVEGDKVIIKATSVQKRALTCNVGERIKDSDIYTFTISNIKSDVEAVLSYSIATITVSTDSNGKVWIGDDENKTSGQFYSGQQVVIHAVANDRFRLFRWNDNNRETSRTIIVREEDAEYSANFISSDLIPGKFTVSEGKQVFFSKGNLWYGEATFHFESNQYESTPSAGGHRDENHISHFMWCNTAEKAMALRYDDRWDGETPFFAANNFIVNGYSRWCVLTGGDDGEWKYLINKDNECGQTVRSDKYKWGVKVCNRPNCLILLPDDWKWGENGVGSDWLGEYSESTTVTWSTMENAGAVCLPAAGLRISSDENVHNVDYNGYYWSPTPFSQVSSYFLTFDRRSVTPVDYDYRSRAIAVRLVTECL